MKTKKRIAIEFSLLTLAIAIAMMTACAITPLIAKAQSLDLGGVTSFIGDMVKQSKGGTLATLGQRVGGALYVSPWTFHDASGIKYFETEVGGKILIGGHASPLLGFGFDITSISGKIWSSPWAQSHVTRLALPDIWVGPYVNLAFPLNSWTWKNEFGGMVSIPL